MVAAFFITLFALAALALYLSIRFWKVARYGWLVIALLLVWFVARPIAFQRHLVKATIPPIFEVVEETQFDSSLGYCTFAEYRVRMTGNLDDLPSRYIDRTEAFQQAVQGKDILIDDIPPNARFYVKDASYWDVFRKTSYQHAVIDSFEWMIFVCSSYQNQGTATEEKFRRVDLPETDATAIFGGSEFNDERWIYNETTGLLTYYGTFRY